MKKISKLFKKYFFISQFVITLFLGFAFSFGYTVFLLMNDILEKKSVGYILDDATSIFLMGLIVSLLIYPFVLTVYEIIYLLSALLKDADKVIVTNNKKSALYDCLALSIGVILTYIVLSLNDVIFGAYWYEELVNAELHAPINPDCVITFVTLSALFFVGMIILSYTSPQKRPPLVTVLCIAMMYIGVIEACLFTIQILGMHYTNSRGEVKYVTDILNVFICFLPLNMILMLVRTIVLQTKLYKPDENRMSKIDEKPFLSKCNKLLCNANNWPVLAIIAMVPLLGIVIAILALFGQAPDSAIKAFTETANYTLSTKIPPQNVSFDEHYLCTVAAGGHRKIVKPIRMGKRHGHAVVVNRQLMIANAFEQVLEERTPRFHRAVRNFYDTYGFPIARLIKSKLIADVIWFLMKPLEWLFLVVLYLVDVNPEDRINKQYL